MTLCFKFTHLTLQTKAGSSILPSLIQLAVVNQTHDQTLQLSLTNPQEDSENTADYELQGKLFILPLADCITVEVTVEQGKRGSRKTMESIYEKKLNLKELVDCAGLSGKGTANIKEDIDCKMFSHISLRMQWIYSPKIQFEGSWISMFGQGENKLRIPISTSCEQQKNGRLDKNEECYETSMESLTLNIDQQFCRDQSFLRFPSSIFSHPKSKLNQNIHNYAKQENQDDKKPIETSQARKGGFEISKERKEFYKGPCQSKNLFSCCDVEVEEQHTLIIEPSYI